MAAVIKSKTSPAYVGPGPTSSDGVVIACEILLLATHGQCLHLLARSSLATHAECLQLLVMSSLARCA
eukprot:1154673-Pelagomonas_calceolata.AAC.6